MFVYDTKTEEKMSDSTSTTEPLEIPPESPFPAMLLLKKKPPMMDAAARSAELANFQKTGEFWLFIVLFLDSSCLKAINQSNTH